MAVLKRAELREAQLAEVRVGRRALVFREPLLRLRMDLGDLYLVPLPTVDSAAKGGGFELGPAMARGFAPFRIATPNPPRQVEQVDRRAGEAVDDVASRIRPRVDKMLVINGHRVDHNASRTPSPIRRLDRIGQSAGRVIAELVDLTKVIRERKRLTVNIPTDAPKGRGKRTDRRSDTPPNVGGGPI